VAQQRDSQPGTSCEELAGSRYGGSLDGCVAAGKRIMGYQQLWMLEAKLKDLAEEASVDTKSQVV